MAIPYWLNELTGISQGSFDTIYLRDANGNMVDLLTLLGTLGGGITDVISQSSELVTSSLHEWRKQDPHAESRRLSEQLTRGWQGWERKRCFWSL